VFRLTEHVDGSTESRQDVSARSPPVATRAHTWSAKFAGSGW